MRVSQPWGRHFWYEFFVCEVATTTCLTVTIIRTVVVNLQPILGT